MTKILVADDEVHIRELIRMYLQDEGFELVEKSNGQDALEYVGVHSVDLAILDDMMPKLDGWTVCSHLRKLGDTPILMVTAKGESADRIKGFILGADDFLVKPFDPVELVLRVKALLRRSRISTSNMVKIGDITLDRRKYHVVYKNGKTTTLPSKEFELLYKLGSYPGQLFTRDELIEKIWGIDYEGDERTVDVHIRRLRERFSEFELDFKIVTVRGLGYRLEVYRE